MSVLGVCLCVLAPDQEGFFLVQKSSSKITVVDHALKLAAVISDKRMLLYMDDCFKLSMASLLHWPRRGHRCLTAGLSPTEVSFRSSRVTHLKLLAAVTVFLH